MLEPNCHLPAHPLYRSTMRILHLLDIPLYVTIIVVLWKIKSAHFQKYKYYLIWQILLNEATEFHNTYLMLPVFHLPYPLFRCTGLLAEIGFSGLFLFYILSILIIHTGCSTLEMFYFRYRAGLYDYKTRTFTRFLKVAIWIFRFCVLLFKILMISTFFYSIQRQEVYKHELVQAHPLISPEVTCYSVILAAPFSDSVMICTMILWFTLIIITFTVIPSTTVYLNAHLRGDENSQMSPAVLKMQKMLLWSLIVQSFLHGIMLEVPNILFVYAIFFGADYEAPAYLAFISLTFHGLFSSLAMIYFTKPIKDGVFDVFKSILTSAICCKSRKAQKSSAESADAVA